MEMGSEDHRTYKSYFIEWTTDEKKHRIGFTTIRGSLGYIGYDMIRELFIVKLLWFQYNFKQEVNSV